MLSAERSKVMTDPMLFFQVLKREHLHRCEYREMNILKAMWGDFTHAVRDRLCSGITSAAMDGLRVAEAVAAAYAAVKQAK